MSMKLQRKLENFVHHVDDPICMLELGLEYEELGQYASAIGYYHLCAERTDSDILAYECLIRMALCYYEQGGREAHEENSLLLAVAHCPHRCEAYYHLSLCAERKANRTNEDWIQSYAWAVIGYHNAWHQDKRHDSPQRARVLRTDVQYPGKHLLKFQKGVALWWLGRFDECRNIFLEMKEELFLYSPHYKQLIENNIINTKQKERPRR